MPLPENPSTSLSLLEQVKNNEPSGWERLAAIYGPIVYHWSRLAGLQPADSANVLQEVFRAVYLNIHAFNCVSRKPAFAAG